MLVWSIIGLCSEKHKYHLKQVSRTKIKDNHHKVHESDNEDLNRKILEKMEKARQKERERAAKLEQEVSQYPNLILKSIFSPNSRNSSIDERKTFKMERPKTNSSTKKKFLRPPPRTQFPQK